MMAAEMPPDLVQAYQDVLADLRIRRRETIEAVRAERVPYLAICFDLAVTRELLGFMLDGLRDIWEERDSGLRQATVETLGRELRHMATTVDRLRQQEPESV